LLWRIYAGVSGMRVYRIARPRRRTHGDCSQAGKNNGKRQASSGRERVSNEKARRCVRVSQLWRADGIVSDANGGAYYATDVESAASSDALALRGCRLCRAFLYQVVTRYHLISIECSVNSVFFMWLRFFLFCPLWVENHLVATFAEEQFKTRQNT